MRKAKRCVHVLIAVVLILTMTLGLAGSTYAQGTKENKKKIIGIVFDNSSSMIWSSDQTQEPIGAWCRATYALEVFASMLNEGDELYVYPMNEISVEKGGSKSKYTMRNPLVVNGGTDPTFLETIKTVDVNSANTPLSSISVAGSDIKERGSYSDEKWLIVLTDGNEFCEDESGAVWLGPDSKKRVEELLNEDNEYMNVMYLGIGNGINVDLKGDPDHVSYATKADDSKEITQKLTKMCNMIFGRDELEVNNDSFETKITMSKVIVFAQGDVTDASGMVPGLKPDKAVSLKYSTSHEKPDKSLKGAIATYTDVAIGTYDLPAGLEVAVYYEPDVDLHGVILDEEGNDVTEKVRSGEGLPAGRYIFKFELIDNGTGKPADGEQLGEVTYDVTYVLNGETYTIEGEGQEIAIDTPLERGDTIQVSSVTVHYLNGYTLTKSGEDLDMTQISIKDDIDTMTLSVPDEVFQIYVSEVNGYSFIMENFSDKDRSIPMTAEEMDRQTIDIQLEGGNIEVDCERDGSNYILTLRFDGPTKDIITGPYTMTLQTTYENSNGEKKQSNVGVVQIEVLPEPHSVALEMDVPTVQNYYKASSIEDEKPIRVTIEKDGQPLTDEELGRVIVVSSEAEIPEEDTEAIYVLIDTDGIDYEYEIVPGKSAIDIRLKKTEDGPSVGDYEITAKACYFDDNGIMHEAQTSEKITVGIGPWWLKWLIAILIIVVIGVLLWLFMNMKVLPKKIDIESSIYRIEGEKTSGSAHCSYRKNGKKGTIHITSPNNPNYPLCKCALDISVEAESPRYVPSRRRKVKVTRTPNCGGMFGLNKLKVGTTIFHVEYNDDDMPKGIFMKGQKAQSPEPLDYGHLQSGSECRIEKDVTDEDAGIIDVVFSVKLIFK